MKKTPSTKQQYMSHSQPILNSNMGDRFIPVRGDKNENQLQELLMDISLDESGGKKDSSGPQIPNGQK